MGRPRKRVTTMVLNSKDLKKEQDLTATESLKNSLLK